MSKNSKIKDDCFALPKGINWCPVDTALEKLKNGLSILPEEKFIPSEKSLGFIISQPIYALISNPNFSNSAVDGYGFHCENLSDENRFTLLPKVAYAGADFVDIVPQNYAIRIMTGAKLPKGVNTVVLNEDVTLNNDQIFFRGKLEKGSNTRLAGEDVKKGDLLFNKGHRIKVQDLALLVAAGVKYISVYEPLKVGILSTGDEILDSSIDIKKLSEGMIFDCNRPLLSSLLSKWGCEIIDLGVEKDNYDKLKSKLNYASKKCDVLLTSGGASSGNADFLSQMIKDEGKLFEWRIAIKPGRPLSLGLWNKMPIFGLPGNPVAAFVCTLLFFYPSMSLMGGAGWREPVKFQVPSNFIKKKRAGRKEYLRARINNNGMIDVFKSEGSGRISGLSWSTGLVELSEEAMEINKGDRVNFIAYSSYGI